MTDKELTNQKPVAWMYTNAQGETVIVEGDEAPYVDAVPLYSHCPPPKPSADAGIMIWGGGAQITRIFSEGELAMARYQAGIIKETVNQMLDKIVALKF